MTRPPESEVPHPFATRYASEPMRALFSPIERARTWRRLWLELARAQRELGLPIRAEQIAQLEATLDDIDLARVARLERELRHDVMAHIHAWGEKAPAARPILHLGATSCFVTDNADLVILRRAIDLLLGPIASAVRRLRDFALAQADLPCVAYTHFQPAQLTTLGKRAALWLQDLVDDLERLERLRDGMLLRGAKGTTGTQASFLALFDGDEEKVERLDRRIAEAFDFPGTYPITGQTYPRKKDAEILQAVALFAVSAHKAAGDLRLLAHEREVEEPFGRNQVGSSAMPYKRNPMRCERICSLARFVQHQVGVAQETASHQWLERTLDDSAARRAVLPDVFLAADGIAQTLLEVAGGLVVHPEQIRAHVERELPFMASEEILMEAVRRGGDRQDLHERIRRHALEAAERVKRGEPNDLLARIGADPAFASVAELLPALGRAERFVGRAPAQVRAFVKDVVDPVLERFEGRTDQEADVRV